MSAEAYGGQEAELVECLEEAKRALQRANGLGTGSSYRIARFDTPAPVDSPLSMVCEVDVEDLGGPRLRR